MLLTGTYPRTLDDKNRLALPKRAREQLADPEKLFVTPGKDQCLWLFTQEALDQFATQLDQAPETDTEVLLFRRLFFPQIEAVDVDANGRILVPDRLLREAGLQHDVVLLGVRNHLELWDAARWQSYERENAARFDAVAERAFRK